MKQHVPQHQGARRRWAVLALTGPALVLVTALAPVSTAVATSAPLIGTLQLAAGSCSGSAPTGSYLRMVLPSGSASGPYLSNSDSSCSDQSYTLLAPGVDGGLTSGSYQPFPSPAFDANGNALAHRITQPTTFYGTGFATGSTAVDPQTALAVPVPTVTANGSTLTADLRSFSVTWNNQYFNQGSPKPGGGYPGNTRPATGSYDASTGAFTLSWTSQVIGGPFDKFTGLWHLQGTFAPGTGTGTGTGTDQAGTSGNAADSHTTTGGAARPVQGHPGQGHPGAAAVPPAAGAAPPAAAGTTAGSTAVTALDTRTGSADSALTAAAPGSLSRTSTQTSWQVSWWLIALAVALAVVGFGVLFGLQRLALRQAVPLAAGPHPAGPHPAGPDQDGLHDMCPHEEAQP